MEPNEKRKLMTSIPFARVSATVADPFETPNAHKWAEEDHEDEEDEAQQTNSFLGTGFQGARKTVSSQGVPKKHPRKNLNSDFGKMQSFIEGVERKVLEPSHFESKSNRGLFDFDEPPFKMSSFMKEDTSVVPTGPSQPKPSSWIVPSSSSSSTAAASRDLFASRSLSTSVAIPSGHSSSSPAEPLYMPEDEPFPTERRASDTAMEQGKRGSRELKKAKSTVSRTLPKGLGENAGPFSPTEVNQLARFLNKSPFDDRFNDYQADDTGYPTKKRSNSGFFTNRDSFSDFDDLGQDLSMDEDLRPHRPPPGFGEFKRIDNSRSVPDLRSVGSSSSTGGGW